MEKYFVTYNQALALKELGFNENCLASWNFYTNEFNYNPHPSTFSSDDVIQLPLKSQVFEWFREKYNILNEITFFREDKRTKKAYWFTIFKWGDSMVNREIIRDKTVLYYLTYEQADSACIDKLIEIVKNEIRYDTR